MFCYNCGENLPDGSRLCSSCGQQLASASAQAATAATKPSEKKDMSEITALIKDSQFKKIVNTHATGAAAAAVGSVWIPGVGSTIATTIEIGFVGTMYYRMSAYLGIGLSKDAIKSLSAAVVGQLAAGAVAKVAAGAVLSFIPVLGTATATGLVTAGVYAEVKLAATIYQKIIIGILSTDRDISSISSQEMKGLVKDSISSAEIKSELEKAKKEYKIKKESGELDTAEKAAVMDEFKDSFTD